MADHGERHLLHAYIDDELDLVRSLELEEHLAECPDCAQEVASYRALRQTITPELRYKAPGYLRSGVLNRLENAERPKPAGMGSGARVASAADAALDAAAASMTTDRERGR